MLLVLSTLLLLVALPLALLLWCARPSSSVMVWGLKAVAVAGYGVALFYGGPWYMLSYYLRYGLIVLIAGAAGYGLWRMRAQPLWVRPHGWQWGTPVAAVLLLVFTGPVISGQYKAQQVPPDPVALTFPLQDGAFYVASGGSHDAMNPHMKVAAPELHAWRGQMWALDIVALYRLGNRAQGLYPTRLDRYAIFGVPVYAPCEGRVVAVENSLPDLVPPAADTTNKAGNYVTLRCGGEAYVLLAHLQHGSVTVQPGQRVSVDTQLGAVGNSGNTSEPHLHINAQRTVGQRTPIDAEPRPITFDGAFLLRNDVVRPTE